MSNIFQAYAAGEKGITVSGINAYMKQMHLFRDNYKKWGANVGDDFLTFDNRNYKQRIGGVVNYLLGSRKYTQNITNLPAGSSETYYMHQQYGGLYNESLQNWVESFDVTGVYAVPTFLNLKTALNQSTRKLGIHTVEDVLGASIDTTGTKLAWHDFDMFVNALPDNLFIVTQMTWYSTGDGAEAGHSGDYKGGAPTIIYDYYTPNQYTYTNAFGQKYDGQAFTGYVGDATGGGVISRINTGFSGLHIHNPLLHVLYSSYDGVSEDGFIYSYLGSNTGWKNPTMWGYFVYGTMDEWTAWLKSWGMKYAFEKGGTIYEPPMPGQPSNPVDTEDGDGDNESDTVEYPNVGYVPNAYTRYWLKPSQIPDLKQFLFSQSFLEDIRRLWTSPGEYIVDNTYYPLDPTALGLAGNAEFVVVGNLNAGLEGYIYPDNAAAYHYAGGVTVEPYYNSYLDYEPYTSISIYIPYIGVRPLNVSRLTGHTLKLAYTFDFGTRQITAHLGLDGNMSSSGGYLGNALESFTGAFGVSQPFSGTQNNQMILNVMQQTAGLITGAGAIAGGIASGNPTMIAGGAISAAHSIGSGHLSPETYGTLTPTAGLYAPQIPYLIINRPITAEPKTWAADMGYSAGYSGKVSEFTGYLQALHVDLVRAETMTDQESTAIINALEEGILI